MDKQKQIEEEFQFLYHLITDTMHDCTAVYPIEKRRELMGDVLGFRRQLAKNILSCYRPTVIPENSVVLTREEYEELQKGVHTINYTAMMNAGQEERIWQLENRLACAYETASKETVEKIVSNIEDILQEPYKGKTEKQEYQRKGMTEGLKMALEICKEIMEK